MARLPSCAGMLPVRLLLPRSSLVRAERLPISAGMLPVRLLRDKSSDATLPEVIVMFAQVSIFCEVAAPQLCNGADAAAQ